MKILSCHVFFLTELFNFVEIKLKLCLKKALHLSVNVFSTKVLIGDATFTCGHPSHAKV